MRFPDEAWAYQGTGRIISSPGSAMAISTAMNTKLQPKVSAEPATDLVHHPQQLYPKFERGNAVFPSEVHTLSGGGISGTSWNISRSGWWPLSV